MINLKFSKCKSLALPVTPLHLSMFTHTKKIVNPASGNKDFDIQLQKKNPRKTQAMHANKKGTMNQILAWTHWA